MLIKGELHELHIFQIMLNRTLSHEFEKWYKFLSQITAKLHKTNSCRKRPASQMGGGGTAATHLQLQCCKGVVGQHHAPVTLPPGKTCYP
jgi:hypothetical protein